MFSRFPSIPSAEKADRRYGSRLLFLSHIVSVVAALVALGTALFAAFQGLLGEQTPPERYVLLVIFLAAFIYYVYRANRNERALRYRRALRYLHQFNHSIRQFHVTLHTNRQVARDADNFKGVDDLYYELEDILQDACNHIVSAFEMASGKDMKACIKMLQTLPPKHGGTGEESSDFRLVARTVTRDSSSRIELAKVDAAIIANDLDALDRNTHFDQLVGLVPYLHYSSAEDMKSKVQWADARRGFEYCGQTCPVESMLMAGIVAHKDARGNEQQRLKEKKSSLRTTDSDAILGDLAANFKTGELPGVEAIESASTKTIGIVYVDSTRTDAFRRDDIQLIFTFADALYWPLTQLGILGSTRDRLRYKKLMELAGQEQPKLLEDHESNTMSDDRESTNPAP